MSSMEIIYSAIYDKYTNEKQLHVYIVMQITKRCGFQNNLEI